MFSSTRLVRVDLCHLTVAVMFNMFFMVANADDDADDVTVESWYLSLNVWIAVVIALIVVLILLVILLLYCYFQANTGQSVDDNLEKEKRSKKRTGSTVASSSARSIATTQSGPKYFTGKTTKSISNRLSLTMSTDSISSSTKPTSPFRIKCSQAPTRTQITALQDPKPNVK